MEFGRDGQVIGSRIYTVFESLANILPKYNGRPLPASLPKSSHFTRRNAVCITRCCAPEWPYHYTLSFQPLVAGASRSNMSLSPSDRALMPTVLPLSVQHSCRLVLRFVPWLHSAATFSVQVSLSTHNVTNNQRSREKKVLCQINHDFHMQEGF